MLARDAAHVCPDRCCGVAGGGRTHLSLPKRSVFTDPVTDAINPAEPWSLDLDTFTAPVPLARRRLGAPAKPGVYVITCGACVPHVGTSSKLQARIRSLAALGNHRGSAEVLCAAHCTGVAPTVQWRETQSAAEARVLEREFKARGEPPQPRGNFAGCVNGTALRNDLVAAAGPTTWKSGYIAALFDVGEQLYRIFDSRFDDVWAALGRPPGPWST